MATFTASQYISGTEAEAAYVRMRAAIEAGIQKNGSQARPYAKDGKLSKDVILAMQGGWNG